MVYWDQIKRMTQNLPNMPKAVNLLTGQRYLTITKEFLVRENDHLKWLRYAEGWRPDDWTGEIKRGSGNMGYLCSKEMHSEWNARFIAQRNNHSNESVAGESIALGFHK